MISIAGSYRLEAPPEVLWPRIFDPRALMSLIPGCQELKQVEAGQYRGQIQIGMAAVSGTYETCVRVVEQVPPARCRFEGQVSGPTGIIKGEALFNLQKADGGSLIEYEAQAQISGALAKLSPRFIEGVVKALVQLGFANLNRQLRARHAEVEK